MKEKQKNVRFQTFQDISAASLHVLELHEYVV